MFNKLPTEIIAMIFSMLDLDDIIEMCKVNIKLALRVRQIYYYMHSSSDLRVQFDYRLAVELYYFLEYIELLKISNALVVHLMQDVFDDIRGQKWTLRSAKELEDQVDDNSDQVSYTKGEFTYEWYNERYKILEGWAEHRYIKGFYFKDIGFFNYYSNLARFILETNINFTDVMFDSYCAIKFGMPLNKIKKGASEFYNSDKPKPLKMLDSHLLNLYPDELEALQSIGQLLLYREDLNYFRQYTGEFPSEWYDEHEQLSDYDYGY